MNIQEEICNREILDATDLLITGLLVQASWEFSEECILFGKC